MANPLSALSQWKILDNLRRSLVPVALLLLLVGSWLLFPDQASPGVLLLLGILTLPSVLAAAVGIVQKPSELPWVLHLRGQLASCARQAGLLLLTLAFLPYDAFISADAIGRTLLRLLVTRKRIDFR